MKKAFWISLTVGILGIALTVWLSSEGLKNDVWNFETNTWSKGPSLWTESALYLSVLSNVFGTAAVIFGAVLLWRWLSDVAGGFRGETTIYRIGDR